MRHANPFPIAKRQVWEAYRRVKANPGAAGMDGQTLEEFEQKLGDNLYKLWNRMASGSYIVPVPRITIAGAEDHNASSYWAVWGASGAGSGPDSCCQRRPAGGSGRRRSDLGKP